MANSTDITRVIVYSVGGMIILFLLAGLLTIAIGGFAVVILGFGGFAVPFVVGGLAHMIPRARRRRANIVLLYLEQAIAMNLPLPTMLRAAASAESWKLKSQLQTIASQLEIGEPVSDALRQSAPTLGARSLALIESAEQTGQLPDTLARLVHENRIEAREENVDQIINWVYPIVVFMVLSSVVGSIGIFIIPKFHKIFEDFDTQLPPITLLMFDVARDFGPLATLMGGVMSICMMIWFMSRIFIVEGSMSFPARRAYDELLWHLPLIGPAMRQRGLADILAQASQSAAAGHSLEWIFEDLSKATPNRALRARVQRWGHYLQSGETIDKAARHADLPSFVVGVLSTAQEGGNVPEALAFLARYYRSCFSRLLTLLHGWIWPMIILIMSIIVGIVCYALFLPLVSLIESVT